jgi:hypothetical protein
MSSLENGVAVWLALPLAAGLGLACGCSNDSTERLSSANGNEAIRHGVGTPAPDAGREASGGACNSPPPGLELSGPVVGPTNEYVELCRAGGCAAHNGNFFDTSQVALDYGDFPFRSPSSGNPVGEFFFAVVAPGHENAIFDGAEGNLSDRTPSTVPNDHGGGDSVGDRTIFIAPDQVPVFFPTSHGTHRISFPPSQFMAILLAPFDTTPDGRYLLAVCPTSAASRCDCYFEPFFVEPAADAGAPRVDAGAGGTAGTGGAGGAANGAGGSGGAVGGAGGAANAPCLPDAGNPSPPAEPDGGKPHDAGAPKVDADTVSDACTSP